MTFFSSLFSSPRIPVSRWTAGAPDRSMAEPAVLQSLLDRWHRYKASEVDRLISPVDDMFERTAVKAEAEHHYLDVGVSAIELVTEAMLLARRVTLPRVLDFPCGGGRVTRHLVKFFDDSQISVSDIEREKQAFVVKQFGVKPVECPADFSTPLPEQYDLIFVGSLLSHLDRDLFARALDFFIMALAPEGILVLTTHGRFAATHVAAGRTMHDDPVLKAVHAFERTGFGYVEEGRTRYGVSYGGAFASPEWTIRHIETRPDAMILTYKERAWDNHQDALVVQKLPKPQ
jgi:SAM-dependent methyltransferase